MIPNKLKVGDTIAVIAPSNAVNEDDIKFLKLTEKMFEKRGINVLYGKNIYSNSLGYGASPREKADDLNDAFLNKDVQAIFCAKGGENSNTIFEYIDYELIKQNPKIFCGFSDSTFLLNMIYEKAGLVTFHGSTFKAISDWDAPCVFEDIINKMVNGNTSLKDIAFCCETLFNIEIGDFYRIFLEIRNRKKSRTQFLDKLKDKIIKMMDELDK